METDEYYMPDEDIILSLKSRQQVVFGPNIFKLHEENIGLLTAMISDILRNSEKLYSAEWLADAVEQAVANNTGKDLVQADGKPGYVSDDPRDARIGDLGCPFCHGISYVYCDLPLDSPIFVTSSDLLDHLSATFSPSSTTTYEMMFEEERNAQLLILNYLDTMNATPRAKKRKYQSLNYHYQAQLPTVITLGKPIQNIAPNVRSRNVDAKFCTMVQMFHAPMCSKNPDVDVDLSLSLRKRKESSLRNSRHFLFL